MQIEDIVKEVLEYTPFVSLAGIGSFTVRRVSAVIEADKQEISAPRNVYSFLRDRKFEDGALATHLQTYRDLAQEEASRIVCEWICGIDLRLEAGERVRFAGIGYLAREGEEVVYTADALPFDAVLHCPHYHLHALPQSAPKGKSSGMRPWIWAAAGMVLATALGLGGYYYYMKYLVHAPVYSPEPPVAEANVPPLPLDSGKAKTGETIDSAHAQQIALRIDESADNHAQTGGGDSIEGKPSTEGLYYVVIAGSFCDYRAAERVKADRVAEGYEVRIMPFRDKFRVVIGTYPTYADAVRVKTTYCTRMRNPNAAFVPKQPIAVEN